MICTSMSYMLVLAVGSQIENHGSQWSALHSHGAVTLRNFVQLALCFREGTKDRVYFFEKRFLNSKSSDKLSKPTLVFVPDFSHPVSCWDIVVMPCLYILLRYWLPTREAPSR